MSDIIYAITNMSVKHDGERYAADTPITNPAVAKFLVSHGLARPAEPDMNDTGTTPWTTSR